MLADSFTVGIVGTLLSTLVILSSFYVLTMSYWRREVLARRTQTQNLTNASIILSQSFFMAYYARIIYSKGSIYDTQSYWLFIMGLFFYYVSVTVVCVSWLPAVTLEDRSLTTARETLYYQSLYNSATLKQKLFVFATLLLGSMELYTAVNSSQRRGNTSTFFLSEVYITFVGVDLAQNVYFTMSLLLFGYRFIKKFQAYVASSYTYNEQLISFKLAFAKITRALFIITFCSLCRLILQVCEIILYIQHTTIYQSQAWILRGVVGVLIFDVIPTAFSCLALIWLVKPSRSDSLAVDDEYYAASESSEQGPVRLPSGLQRLSTPQYPARSISNSSVSTLGESSSITHSSVDSGNFLDVEGNANNALQQALLTPSTIQSSSTPPQSLDRPEYGGGGSGVGWIPPREVLRRPELQ